MMADGRPVPGTTAADVEVLGLCAALGRAGRGVVQLVTAGERRRRAADDPDVGAREFDLIRRVAEQTGPSGHVPRAAEHRRRPVARRVHACARDARATASRSYPQVGDRCFGVLMGHQSRLNPFRTHPTYAAIARLAARRRASSSSATRRSARRSCPSARSATGSRRSTGSGAARSSASTRSARVPEYEPDADAERRARSPAAKAATSWEVAYDVLLRDDGQELLLLPLLNYGGGSYDALHEMMSDPLSVQGLGDGGAHSGIICDASMTTYLLSHWVVGRTPRSAARARARGPASHRRPGRALRARRPRCARARPARRREPDRARSRCALHRPEQVQRSPGGRGPAHPARERVRRDVVAGEPILEQGEPTGALPGRLVRGAR